MFFHLSKELLQTIQPRPSVMLLAQLMEFKLRKNAHKSKNWPSLALDDVKGRMWDQLSLDYLASRLEDERTELDTELLKKFTDLEHPFDATNVILECADEANFLMMIVDNIIEGRTMDGLDSKMIDHLDYPYSKDMQPND